MSLALTAAACVLAQDIHNAARKCDPSLPEWRDLTKAWKDDAIEDAAIVILHKRRKRMVKAPGAY